jgi:hypothetical protein
MRKFSIVTLLFLLPFFADAQDFLVLIKLKSSAPAQGRIISSNSEYLNFLNAESGDTDAIPLNSINKIQLGTPDEVYLNDLSPTYIPCQIKNIGIDFIRFRDFQTGQIINFAKDRIFACQFSDTCASEIIRNYYSVYTKKFISQIYSNDKTIVKKNSENIKVKGIIFNDSIISIDLMNKELLVKTYINRNNIQTIFFSSDPIKPVTKHGQDFILTRQGNIYDDCSITRISDDQIFFTSAKDAITHETKAPKNMICALLFYNFDKEKKISK